MSERRFARGLGKPGTAAQLRETVSQVVRESTVLNKPQLVEPLDFELFLQKNKTLLQNDPHRELLLYPPDDISEVILPRRHRTLYPQVVSSNSSSGNKNPAFVIVPEQCNSLFTKQCINSYVSNWNLIHYKYSAYSGSWMDLPNLPKTIELKEDNSFEIDIDNDDDADEADDVDGGGCRTKAQINISKEGYLLKGPDIIGHHNNTSSNISFKTFKRRYCFLRQEVVNGSSTWILEMYKDENKNKHHQSGEAKHVIVLDFCTDVVKNLKRGRYCFELRMTIAAAAAEHNNKSCILAAENEAEFKDWLMKLNCVLQQNKLQEEKRRVASLERTTSLQQQQQQCFGTLKGLEQSLNPQLIRYGHETDVSIALARRDNRNKLFMVYPQLAMNLIFDNKSQEIIIEPYKEVFGNRVLLKFEHLKFKLQAVDERENLCPVEPYYATCCLFDIKLGRKLTENYHFDVTTNRKQNLIIENQNQLFGLPETLSYEWINGEGRRRAQAIFNITNPHPDIFLVVRIEKVLQGGTINQISEPYLKLNKDCKVNAKVARNIGICCERLGKYRMPFAWCARPLFRLYSNELDTTSDFNAIYRQETNKLLTDEEFIKLLMEYRKPDKFSKFTVIPGTCQVKISSLINMTDCCCCLTTSLAPLKPFPIPPPPSSSVTIEIAEFENNHENIKDVHPYTVFLNHLYVYPLQLNFDSQKVFARARNLLCVIQLRDSDNEEAKPLKCIYGRPGENLLIEEGSCAVLYHKTTPNWYDEIKVRLPINLLSTHHFLFKFYHISCKHINNNNNNWTSTIENCVGYSWLPLLDNKGKLNIDTKSKIINLPVAVSLPPGYLSIQPLGLGQGNSGPEIQWIDGQKGIFNVAFNLYSTVNTIDGHLFNFFIHAEKLLKTNLSSENETCKILKALHAIQPTTLITFLPTILNQLFHLLVVSKQSNEIGLNIVRVTINLINMVYDVDRKDILEIYIKYVFVNPISSSSSNVHEELCKYLPIILHPNNTDFLVVDKFMHHSEFFFNIINKSMVQHLLSSSRIKMHRNERFPKEFLDNIVKLIEILIPYILNKYRDMPNETCALNKSCGIFLKKSLSIMDRGFVFKLINIYMERFNPGDVRLLYEYKFTFLEILSSHEHFITFNLPIYSLSSQREFILNEEFSKHHFIVALLLQEVKTSLNQVPQIRRLALNTLRDLVAKHEFDDRYENKGQLNRIALLYIPWLNIVLENLNRLNILDKKMHRISRSSSSNNKSSADPTATITGSSDFTLKNWCFDKITDTTTTTSSSSVILDNNSSPMHIRNSAFFDAIAGQSFLLNDYGLSDDLSSAQQQSDGDCDSDENNTIVHHKRTLSALNVQQQRFDKLQLNEVKDILIMFLFVIKYIGEEQLITWWQQHQYDLVDYFKLLEISLHCFKYNGKKNVQLVKTTTKTTTTNSRNNITTTKTSKKAHTLPARMNANSNHEQNPISTLIIHMDKRGGEDVFENEVHKKQQIILEQHLGNEVALIILDTIGLYCMNFRKNLIESNGEINDITRKIFDIYLTFIQIGQSEFVFKHLFAALRSFINNYSIVLFEGNATIYCGRLCYELLKCFNSRLTFLRQESCALLYLLMRSNFEFTERKEFIRVHLQCIISVSQMLGNTTTTTTVGHRFQESLSMINSFAKSDKAMKHTNFPLEVIDLTKRIHTVLMATLKMREHNHDPEMLIDLQHSLANSYASTPELRHTWLETMSKQHVYNGNYSEAAACQLHIAALITEYLKLKKIEIAARDDHDAVFQTISSNIFKDEKGLKLDYCDGGGDINYYNEHTLLEQLETCAEFIDKSERYEIMGDLYKLILPIYERERNYEMLKKSHQLLADNYEKVIERRRRRHRRFFGRYYRVQFHGLNYFGDQHQVEYVYKEPKVTSLSEITERLQKQFRSAFGGENDILIMHLESTAVNDLDPKFAYIQVTHVVPYSTAMTKTTINDDFQQNHNIDTFMFETPFTKLDDGKSQSGNPEEQWKRRTILKTEYTFPYLTKRIKVISRRTLELSPIEVAIDEMQNRVQELEEVVFTKPTDVKKLQLLLQGSVCVQVNAGPLAYANAFLNLNHHHQYPEEKVEELKDIYREFLKISYTALQINATLIIQDQQEYQQVLRDNYKKLCSSLSDLFGEPLWPHDDIGSFNRNSMALFSAIHGTSSHHSSTA